MHLMLASRELKFDYNCKIMQPKSWIIIILIIKRKYLPNTLYNNLYLQKLILQECPENYRNYRGGLLLGITLFPFLPDQLFSCRLLSFSGANISEMYIKITSKFMKKFKW